MRFMKGPITAVVRRIPTTSRRNRDRYDSGKLGTAATRAAKKHGSNDLFVVAKIRLIIEKKEFCLCCSHFFPRPPLPVKPDDKTRHRQAGTKEAG